MLKAGGQVDLDLRDDVEAELENDSSLHAAGIGVAVNEGVVTLSGHVPAYWQKLNAGRDVERVKGVRGIVNDIEVRSPSERTDPNIAEAVVAALAGNSQVPGNRITVTVMNGWVTMQGKVDQEYQRRAAERTVRDVHGVRGVLNNLELTPAAHAEDVKLKIESSFQRQALIDARDVTVIVSGHEVKLIGTVRSWAERREAQNAAAATPGVTKVDNCLQVRA